ncbi:hypothetical protein RHGRI_032567 [Rhododendron griersonianum]|uniref:Fe2OG dioxygenase domain-containing protein n=1 Tax=Rhododendron griersonianum TaxID=479676 RepID=A0AAV6ICV6_9ERIC|nr:hypothetical protein RHGRI_032567 [Rhododendron griersonianum]
MSNSTTAESLNTVLVAAHGNSPQGHEVTGNGSTVPSNSPSQSHISPSQSSGFGVSESGFGVPQPGLGVPQSGDSGLGVPQFAPSSQHQYFPQNFKSSNRGRGGRSNHSTNFCYYRRPNLSASGSQWRCYPDYSQSSSWMNPMMSGYYPSNIPVYPSFPLSAPRISPHFSGAPRSNGGFRPPVASGITMQQFPLPSQLPSQSAFAGFTDSYVLPAQSSEIYDPGSTSTSVYRSDNFHNPTSQPWYFDRRATNHITNNMQNLNLAPPQPTTVNVVRGLKLYEDIFTDSELSKLRDLVNELRAAGHNGKLSGETYILYNQQRKGGKRELIKLGAPIFCHIKEEATGKGEDIHIEPIPTLLQGVIDHLIQWQLISENTRPNSCIINFFDKGEYSQPFVKPPHLEQPISTLLLSESTMAFGRTLVSDADGNYEGPLMLSLKEGSLLVMGGNSSNMARHVMCQSPNKRVSITFFRVRSNTNQDDSSTITPSGYEATMGTIPQWGVLYIPVAMVNLAAPMHPRVLSPRMSPNDREIGGDVEPIKQDENLEVLTPDNVEAKHDNANKDDYEANSLVSWKDSADMNDTADTSSLGSWNDWANGWSGPISGGSTSEKVGSPVVPTASPRVRMSWADMAEEDELEEEEENELSRESIDQRKYISFCNLPIKQDENLAVLTPDNVDAKHDNTIKDDYEANSLVSWKDAADMNDTAGTSSLGSWNDGANGWSGPISEGSTSKKVGSPVVPAASPRVRMSWADMAKEDELEEEEENEISRESIDQREYIRFCNLPVKQDENLEVLKLDNVEAKHDNANKDDYEANSLVSWKDAADMNDTADTSSFGSWNDGASGWSGPISEGSTSEKVGSPVVPTASPRVQMSWAYMAQKSIDQREYSRWW